MKFAAKQNSFISMILDLLAVRAVLDLGAIELAQSHDGRDRQRYAFVCGSEQNIKIRSILCMDRAGIKLTELDQLVAALIQAGVHVKRRLSAALQRKFTKLEDS